MQEDLNRAYPMWEAIYHYKARGRKGGWVSDPKDVDRMFIWYVDGTMDVFTTKNTFYTTRRGEYNSTPCGMHDIYGNEVYCAVMSTADEYEARKAYAGAHNHLCEIDIDPRNRFLQRHYQNSGMLNPDMSKINICFLDIEVETTGRFPTAQRAEYPINCVTVYFSKDNRYITYGVAKDVSDFVKAEMATHNGRYELCNTEADLLTKLFTEIGNSSVSILSGWNFSYDTTYMVNRAAKLNVPLDLMSRLPGQFKRAYMDKDGTLNIAGTEVIDFLALYRKYTFSEEPNYKLDYIGGKITGEHKAPLPEGYLSWKNHWDLFILYNFQDVRLLTLIEDSVKMFKLAVSAASEARVPFSSVFESKKMLVGFVLNHLHKNGLVFPPLRAKNKEEFPGAFVYSIPGYYEFEVSYDYRSLYPSIMMTFNISPETKVTFPIDYVMSEEERKMYIKSPWDHNGQYQVYYRKDIEGIVPQVTRLLFDGRAKLKNQMKAAKKAGDYEMMGIYDMMQKVYKVLGNSLYGLLGSPFFAFYDIDNAASITAYGQRLIKYTIKNLAHYMNEEITGDSRFTAAFGYVPKINPDFLGTVLDDEGQELYRRMSHGDTDSFYCKIGDIYEDFSKDAGKKIDIRVFDGNQEVYRKDYDIADEDKAKIEFNRACNVYAHDTWHDPENRAIDAKHGYSKVKIMFHDGIVFQKNIRVVYNRYRLTDFCRILDAVILEDKLAEYMLAYANIWGYYKNELFLKREKCILKAIVTAKKKYICVAESNEDIVYLDKGGHGKPATFELDPDFAITGLEIVRSSTTMFSRDRMLDMVKMMLDTMDKTLIRDRLLEVKKEFFDSVKEKKYSYIAMPSGMKEEPYTLEELRALPKEDLTTVDWRRRGATVWNYLIENDPVLSKEPYEPIYAGSKMKFIKKADTRFGVTTICYSGNECPERLLELFHPDWELHWRVSVAQVLGRLFEAVGWPSELEYDESDAMMEYI